MSVADARALVAGLRGSLKPAEETAPQTLTVGDLLERYDARRLAQLRKRRVIHRALACAFAPLSRREATSLTRRDIAEVVDSMADRAPIHANRVLAYAKAFFGWAVGRGYLEANPAAAISKPTREIARDRTPTIEEVAEIWRAAETLGYPFGHIVQLLILTAARRDEVGAMQLGEPHLPEGGDEGCWTLPSCRSKNGRALRNPLSPLARRVLESALVARVADGPYAFTTTGRTPVSGWSRAKARLDAVIAEHRRKRCELADMPGWRIHDLRRAFATAACDLLHVDPAVADRCLNHVGAGTTSTVARIYARSEMYDQRRDALNRWAELIAGAVAGACARAPSPKVPDRE